MPVDDHGFPDHLCGPTGRVQKALFHGQSATVDLNDYGIKLGFMAGTFDPRDLLKPAELA
jgi:hypothetical protein